MHLKINKHNLARKLVENFCGDTDSWPREIKIAKRLLDICPNLDAWKALNLAFPINSLAFFLTPRGKTFIPNDKTNPYLIERKTVDIHENIVLGED